jgi:1-acyl-sn-glycerol-3-phosphate acyltransferase
MSTTWSSQDPPDCGGPLGAAGWFRVVRRGVPLAIVTAASFVVLIVVRQIERPVFGHHRPVTPWITRFVCACALPLLGIRLSSRGTPMAHRGAVVSNHASWLDIFTLNACQNGYFVSKSEVAGWPGIGWLARATGTVFIARDPRQAKEQKQIFTQRLLAGHKLLFFPEGTSTDGMRVLPFKPTLFEAFFAVDLRPHLYVQPVTLLYCGPDDSEARFYGWWGDMDFGTHLLKTLAAPRHGRIEVVFHAPLKVSDFAGRKDLALHCETVIRGAMPAPR